MAPLAGTNEVTGLTVTPPLLGTTSWLDAVHTADKDMLFAQRHRARTGSRQHD
jgi:hypothetical protein